MKTSRRAFVGTVAGAGLAVRAGAASGLVRPAQATRREPSVEPELREQGCVPLSYVDGQPLRIGNQVQLLVDDYVIEDRWMLKRQVGRVVKHTRNPVLGRSKPWEDAMGAYPSVLYDEERRKYRMWYQCFNLSNYFSRKGPNYYVGYAESDDGVEWVKPALEGFPFAGYPRTNIVTAGREGRRAAGMQVMLNPDPSNAARRFMMVYIGSGKIDLAYSPDGLRWTIVDEPLFRYHSDFPNHLVWVPERRLWHLYVRSPIRPSGMVNGRGVLPEGERHTGRRLAVATSRDLVTWSMPRTIFYPDERDQPDYDNVYVFRRHGVFFALHAQMFMEQGGPEAARAAYGGPSSSSAETEMYVATSRDGIHWERTWDRQPLIPRGPEGAFDHGQVEPGTSPPLEVREEMLVYYYASPNGQSQWFSDTSVGMARLRRDRFIGQTAGEQTGYLLTRQFVLEGTGLEINCSALPIPYQRPSDGIRVAILEAPDYKTPETRWEKAIPGFGLEDCDNIVRDALDHRVTWKGSADLSRLRGRPVYLRFQMKKASLYSFRIAP